RRQDVAGRFVVAGARVSFAVGEYDHTRELVVDPQVAYSAAVGGSSSDAAQAVAFGPTGDVFVVGYTGSSDFPKASALQSQKSGVSVAFVTCIRADGTGLVYSTFLGGSGYDIGYGLAVDATGAAYVAGYTRSVDFPTASPIAAPAFQTAYGGGNYDAFVSKISPAGTSLV